MLPHLVLRDETAADAAVIAEVTIAAFRTLAISNHTEQFIIEALRKAKALIISLVAELNGQIVGHISFSPVTISGDTLNWYAIGPVSVLPEYQRQGIGSALITAGLERLRQLNASGCCLVGHPEYYQKFGFKNTDALVLEGIPPEVFFVLSFGASMPHGVVCFHSAFLADGSK